MSRLAKALSASIPGVLALLVPPVTNIVFLFSLTEFFTLNCRLFVPKYQVFEVKIQVFEEGVCGVILSFLLKLSI